VRAAATEPHGPAVLLVVHSGGLSLLRRAESGAFQATQIEHSTVVRDVAVVDLDGNDAFDLIVASDGAETLQVLEAKGADGFVPAADLRTSGRPRQILPLPRRGGRGGDLIVVTDRGLVHHRHGRRGFESPELLWDEPHLSAVAAADVNGDGRPDLAVTNQSRGTLPFFPGRAGGTFAQVQSYTVGRAPNAVLLVDFDGDGAVDGLTLNRLGDSVTVLRGRGKGRFESSPCILGAAADFDAIAAADFDRDDHLDLAVTSRTEGSVSLFFGDGFGHFAPRPPVHVGRQPRGIVAEDFDGDGHADLAVVNFGGDDVAVLLGDGRGGFHAPILVSVGLGPTAIVAGAFGGDDYTDLAVANSLSRSVSILYGDRRGRFADVVNFAVESVPTFLLTADVDGDGHTDLVVGSERGENVAILHGDGERLQAPEFNALGTIARPSIAEDLNGDGHLDLVVLHASEDALEVLPGEGGGEFGTGLRFPVGRNPTAVLTGDFDGDERVDLAVVQGAARTISILLNRSERRRSEQVARRGPRRAALLDSRSPALLR
jgi:hypothetical protein